ncbi:hypothetical protein E4T38_07731 [Aureobasidium subglaciale]|nr:hypothetical protein E4T38_07731 [Aureobasidium subglaciale]KAI5216781.1 hypothetical protein E4T40_07741 [Aureobasidium subglaciale]KAI5220045.1 hypothetical protein E4T41_07656 [Aureobasidium subglaciale]KAI5257847.1 hypothetical protein E4T46_07632 [Aureobasidium subglaciale]
MDWQTGNSYVEHATPLHVYESVSTNDASSTESATENQTPQAPLVLPGFSNIVSPVGQPEHKKKTPHAFAEKSYRERLNAQVDSLECAIRQYRMTPDMEDMSFTMDRARPKGETIDNATEHIADLWSRFKLRKERNDNLFSCIQGLEKLADCASCPGIDTAGSQLHQTRDY